MYENERNLSINADHIWIKSGVSKDFVVSIVSEAVGHFQGLIYIMFDDYVLVLSVEALVHHNQYGVRPLYKVFD